MKIYLACPYSHPSPAVSDAKCAREHKPKETL